MAAALNNSGHKGRGRRRRASVIADINMTPFIDVMLVLLIIFMVAAPLMTVGVPLDLPQTKGQALNTNQEPITLSVDSKGAIFLMDQPLPLTEVVTKLQAIAKNGYDERIFVRGDKTVDYGTVMKLMGTLSAAGFKRIGLVAEMESGSTPKK